MTDVALASPLSITETAVDELKRVIRKKGNPDIALRVFVSPGGCSGLSYGMSFEESPADDDIVVERDGVRLVVDEVSLMYIGGAEIDYVDALMGGGFTVYNPNAVRSCSCGHSFDTGNNAETARSCG
ncbi:MAG: iron-sulfur cluster insertion protein ErpA [Chloroflexota bacterium]|nr:MAG: iron-sulfur cluster insertion protein ErpA [Chloroflexota bacterium]